MQHHIKLFFGALLISLAPIFVKYIQLSPTLIALYRCFFSFLILLPLFFNWKNFTPPSSRFWLYATGGGFFFALDLILWHRAIFIIGAGLATILANTQVFYVGILGILLLRERPTLRFFGSIILGLLGLFLLIYFKTPSAQSLNFPGIFFGLLAGVAYACFIFCLRQANEALAQTQLKNVMNKVFSPLQSLALTLGFASLFLFLTSAMEGSFTIPTWKDFLYLLLLAFLVQILGWKLISESLNKVPISQSGLLLLTQPAASTLLSSLFFHEHLGLVQIVGAIITFASIYLGTLRKT